MYPIFQRPLLLTTIYFIMWKTTHQVSAPLSFREGGVAWVCHFLGLAGPWLKFFYAFAREKAIVHNWFQPLSCWLSELLFLVLEEGSVKLLPAVKALLFPRWFCYSRTLILVFSLLSFSWYICLWNSLPKHGYKIITFRSIIVLKLLNDFGHCNRDL